jgi:hypothetical protein
MTPVFHPAAEQELAAAMEIGEERGFGLGAELLLEVRRIVALLCETPNIGEPLDKHRRRFPLRRFPFGLIFVSRVTRCAFSLLPIAGSGLGTGEVAFSECGQCAQRPRATKDWNESAMPGSGGVNRKPCPERYP